MAVYGIHEDCRARYLGENRLLTEKKFSADVEESCFEVYEYREHVEVEMGPEREVTSNKRVYDRLWRIEGVADANWSLAFIKHLSVLLAIQVEILLLHYIDQWSVNSVVDQRSNKFNCKSVLIALTVGITWKKVVYGG